MDHTYGRPALATVTQHSEMGNNNNPTSTEHSHSMQSDDDANEYPTAYPDTSSACVRVEPVISSSESPSRVSAENHVRQCEPMDTSSSNDVSAIRVIL